MRLSHGNLVPVFDSGQAGGEIYLAMDFVEGRDLRATWNRCAKKGIAFPIDVAAHLARSWRAASTTRTPSATSSWSTATSRRPTCLLSYSGEVKLTDFGLASSTLKIEKTAPGIIYGKVSYMSPEQARGEKLDGRTDLYATGIILWELLTGRQLFPSGGAGGGQGSATAEELLRRVRNPEPVAPSKRAARVPAELDGSRSRRWRRISRIATSTCEELRHDLAKFLAQTSPATDGTRVAKFLSELYGDDIASERAEREQLISRRAIVHQQALGAAADPDGEDAGHHQRRGRRQPGGEPRRQQRPRGEVRAPAARDGALDPDPGRARPRQAADHPRGTATDSTMSSDSSSNGARPRYR